MQKTATKGTPDEYVSIFSNFFFYFLTNVIYGFTGTVRAMATTTASATGERRKGKEKNAGAQSDASRVPCTFFFLLY